MNQNQKRYLVGYLFYLCVLYCTCNSEGQASETCAPSPLQVGVQLRLRPEVRNNTDYNGNRKYTLLRFRTNLDYKHDSNLKIFFQPQFSKVFGDTQYLGASPQKNTLQDTSGAFYDPAFTVHQAYLDYRFFNQFELLAGRQILSYGDEVLIGALLKWANIGRSFDAIKMIMYANERWQIDFFWSRIIDTGGLEKAGQGDKDFTGLYHQFHIHPFLQNLDLYALYLSDTRATSPMNLWTYGTRFQSNVHHFDYRLEVDYQQGQNIVAGDTVSSFGAVYADQEDLEIGYLIDPQSQFRISAEGFIASPFFNQLFPAAHKWLGTADVLGRRNIMGGAIKSTVFLTKELSLFCGIYRFYRNSTLYPAYKLRGVVELGSIKKSTSSSIGTELDLVTTYQISPQLMLSSGISQLFSDQYLIQNFGPINPMYAFVELEARY